MALALVVAFVRAEAVPTAGDIGWSLLGGVVGGIGIVSLYRGLAVGRMGIVAPVTGVLAAVIPVVAGIVLEGWPDPLVLVGIVARARRGRPRLARRRRGRRPRGPGPGAPGGTAIGLFGVVIAQISDGARVRAARRSSGVRRRSSSSRSSSRPGRPGARGEARARDPRDRRPRHDRQRCYIAGGPDRGAGHRLGRVVALPGHDGHPRRGLPARAGHPLARGRHRPGVGRHRADRRAGPSAEVTAGRSIRERRHGLGRARTTTVEALRPRGARVDRRPQPRQVPLDDRRVDDPLEPAPRSAPWTTSAAGPARSPRPGRRGAGPGQERRPARAARRGSWRRPRSGGRPQPLASSDGALGTRPASTRWSASSPVTARNASDERISSGSNRRAASVDLPEPAAPTRTTSDGSGSSTIGTPR